ncbi:fatty acid desaturase [Candidatus Pelagibacter sp.]|nr:fatty acid desaturase [Candidatus Pelagibacter sp.]
MDVKLDKWHKCHINKEILKELSKKSDLKGFQHVSVFFGLLILTGTIAYITWGTWWSVFWFLVYGNIYSFSNPLWHETGHKTAFKSKYLNEIFYYISSFMSNFEPIRWRYTHFVHHGNTYSTDNPFDHEIEYDNDLKETPKRLLINIIPFLSLFFFKKHIAFEIIQHGLGIKTKVMQDSIPESVQSKAIFNSRVYCFIWLSIIFWSILVTSWLPILYFLLPQFYGKTLHKLVAFTQHAGLARNVKDHRLTSREMYLNPILSFLYWKMEYHLTHHMFPTVPSYNLDKLHSHIKDQLPRTNDGLIDAYKEIIPAIIKQSKDEDYFLKKDIPQLLNV